MQQRLRIEKVLKKRRKEHNSEQRTTTITLEAIERYTYSGFLIMASILLCIYAGLSPRKAVKSLKVINYMFHGLLGEVPCHTTIRTWLVKMGLDIIKNKSIDEAYVFEYLDKETELLTKEHPVHNISSDLIESEFGIFKESMPSNKINGFTVSVLYIPIRAKLGTLANVDNIDIKNIMERRTMNEVKNWKEKNLRQNPMVKRRNLLVA